MTTIRRLDLRAFLEGIEIPAISAVLQVAPNTPAILSLQVIGIDSLLDLKDRTLIHVFFKDLFEEGADMSLETYKLFFVGEVRAIEFTKEIGKRSAVLICEDLSAYWDIALQYFSNFSAGGDAFWDRTSSFVGANKGLFDNILQSVDVMLSMLVNGRSRTRPELRGLLAGVIRLFEGMGGIYWGSNKIFKGMNDFFSQAELRLNIVDQIGVAEKDRSAQRLLNHKVFLKWLTNSLGSYGALLSYRDLLKILFSYVFHEVCPNPIAYYQKGGQKKTIKEVIRKTDTDRVKADEVAQAFVKLRTRTKDLHNRLIKECDTLRDLEARDKKNPRPKGAPSRYSVGKDRIDLNSYLSLTKEISKITKKARQASFYASVRKVTDETYKTISNLITLIEGFMKEGRWYDARDKTKELWNLIKNAYELPTRLITYTHNVITRDRLLNQLIYPNLFFAPPPKCNVIFPEMYNSFIFKREMRREITRLRLQMKSFLDGWARDFGKGRLPTTLLGWYYYAPDVKGIADKYFLRNTNWSVRVLLPHEVHSGIIPAFTELNRVNVYVHDKDPEYAKRGGNIPYVQRVVNFKFFLDRFAARTISVSGPFNEYLVCGFPALVIDRYDRPNATQYLGRIVQMVHSLVPLQSVTQVTLSNCRTHNENEEFLGTTNVSEFRKGKKDPLRGSAISVLTGQAKTVLEQLPNDDPLALEDIARVMENLKKIAEEHRLFAGLQIVTKAETALLEARRFLNEKKLGQSEKRQETAIALLQSLPKTLGSSQENPETVPAEEILRPAWYEKIYRNERIGNEFYQPMIGCGAITDQTEVHLYEEGNPLQLTSPQTIRASIENLVQAYRAVKRSEGDATRFVRTYTKRPVATFDQVMNRFHKHAFGDEERFKDFLIEPTINPLARDTIKKIDPKTDSRKERREMVRRYVEDLKNRVILG